jgi:hypothetical protein
MNATDTQDSLTRRAEFTAEPRDVHPPVEECSWVGREVEVVSGQLAGIRGIVMSQSASSGRCRVQLGTCWDGVYLQIASEQLVLR